ncbi:band 7 family-domain-containing protein [Neocallimastix lanati (nom. inval.)]|jgi:regulator of protease activity HflC (stomatin/prohibitin superfamily)|nr:band 7 family-domain-containing protein [Neocallimastix sp. JGI-2020a]
MSLIFTVKQQNCAIIERFGKYHRIAKSGLHFKIPIVDRISTKLSLKIKQLNVSVETKTKDNVFVNLVVAVQYRVLADKVYEACYMLQDPEQQIKAFVFDLVRAQVPLLDLDDVFSKKDDIAIAVKNELEGQMAEFGYGIIKALVTDVNPDANVKAAMNEINTAQRLRIAATEKGETEKIMKVKQAEAEADAAILQGKGIAGQRQAIIEGLSDSVEEFVKQIPGTDPARVMDMVMMIQYIDTLKEIGGNSKSNVVFVPHSPGNVNDLSNQIRETIFSAQKLN